jgi:hypothetical protein
LNLVSQYLSVVASLTRVQFELPSHSTCSTYDVSARVIGIFQGLIAVYSAVTIPFVIEFVIPLRLFQSDNTMSDQSLVVTGRNVLLPGSDQPQPATITVDGSTGKITDIQTVYTTQQSPGGETMFVDAGDKFVLPGLVE